MVRCWEPLPDRTFRGMAEYRTDLDIRNRALQHCGASRIRALNEVGKNNSETAFCYGKLREAELRRNVWTFACRRTMLRAVDANTMLLNTSLWSPSTTYFVGSIAADQYGNLWISRIPNNLANDPLLSVYWEPYFGPLSVALYDSTIAYFVGELVYTTTGNGLARVYLSLQSDNADNPATATAYDATAVYVKNQVVTYLSVAYMSLIDLNTGNTPSSAPALWDAGTTYGAAATVGGSDGMIYSSVGGGNIGNDPTTDGGVNWTGTGVLNPWTTVFVHGTGSTKWLQIGGAEFPAGVTLTTLNLIYPWGTGPSPDANSKNVFLLPAGYLRRAPQNPKPGLTVVGGPSGVTYDDWLIEGGYLTSRETGPILLRFVADITDVSRMHALFCEGLSARIALAICDRVTQDKGQIQLVARIFKQWEDAALTIDGIEDGHTDPPDDDYVTVRA